MTTPELSLESFQFLLDLPVNAGQYYVHGDDENSAMEQLAKLGYVVKVGGRTMYFSPSHERRKVHRPAKDFMWDVTPSGAEFIANLRVLANV